MNKMKSMKHILLYLAAILVLISCDRGDGKLKIVNNSDDDIYYLDQCNDTITSYPIEYKNDKIDSLFSNLLKVKEEYGLIVVNTKWEYFINNQCNDSTIRIYFFKKELVENVDKETFLKRQVYSKKFKLTVKDLERMNWRVVYDGK